MPTPELQRAAMQELARRELARRQQPQDTVGGILSRNFKKAVKGTFSPETLLTAASTMPVGKVLGAGKYLAQGQRAKLITQAEELLPKVQEELSTAYGKAVGFADKLGKKGNFADIIKQADVAAGLDDGINAIFRKSKLLRRYAKNPELAQNLGARESQDLINSVNSALSRGVKTGSVGSKDIEAIKLVKGLKAQQLNEFNSLKAVNDKYAKTQEAIELLKGKLEPDTALRNIRSGFGNPKSKAAFKLLGKTYDPSLVTNASNYSLGANSLKGALIGGGILGGGQYIRNLISGQ